MTQSAAGGDENPSAGGDENPSGYFDQTLREWNIYYKELVTIVIMLQSLDAAGVTDVDIVLVGDSKAVIGSLRKMMGPQKAWDMLDVVWNLVSGTLTGYPPRDAMSAVPWQQDLFSTS